MLYWPAAIQRFECAPTVVQAQSGYPDVYVARIKPDKVADAKGPAPHPLQLQNTKDLQTRVLRSAPESSLRPRDLRHPLECTGVSARRPNFALWPDGFACYSFSRNEVHRQANYYCGVVDVDDLDYVHYERFRRVEKQLSKTEKFLTHRRSETGGGFLM
jgi:hypothetical protein